LNNPKRIGIFGGTFDPLHETHLDIARTALAHANLDLVLFVVAARPPHKKHGTIASPEDRYDMVSAAIKSEPNMGVSRIEIDRAGPSYTVDTMQNLVEHFPGASFWLIIGMDSLMDFPRWRDPQGILKHARLLVIPRPGEWQIPDALKAHYELLPFNETRLSSTEVRNRIESGEPLDVIVPAPVVSIIQERGLYGSRIADATGA
jgi:nicotinate-nucleotide adenylyltransferase